MVDTWNIHGDDDESTGTSTGTSYGAVGGPPPPPPSTTYDFSGTGSTNNNQVSPGHPGGGYDPNLNPPVVTQPLPGQNNDNQGTPPGGAAGFTPVATGPTEEEIKMARFKEAQANYANYGDDLNLWLEDPTAYEDAVDMGFFTAQNEGVLGGVSEYEKQTNLLKKAIASKVGKMNTQGLTDAQFESGLTSLPEYTQLLQLFDGNQDAMLNTLFDPETFRVTDKGFEGTFDPNVNTGYDPTGTNTWQDTEGDPEKYSAFNLLNDPNADPWSDEYFDALEKIGYNWGPSFDQNWYGMGDWDYNYYGGGPGETENTLLGGDWMSKGLGEILEEGPKSLSEMEGIYDPEFRDREANWLYLTGIPQFKDITTYS